MTTLLYCKVRACEYNLTSLGVNYFERAICRVPKKSMAVKKKMQFQERESVRWHKARTAGLKSKAKGSS